MEREEKKPCVLRRKAQGARTAEPGQWLKNTSVVKGIDSHGKLSYLSDSLAEYRESFRARFVRLSVFSKSVLIDGRSFTGMLRNVFIS